MKATQRTQKYTRPQVRPKLILALAFFSCYGFIFIIYTNGIIFSTDFRELEYERTLRSMAKSLTVSHGLIANFRGHKEKWQSNLHTVMPCRIEGGSDRYQIDAHCRQLGHLLVQNSFRKARIICGTTVEPNEVAVVTVHGDGQKNKLSCLDEPPSLFPVVPNVGNTMDLPPIKLRRVATPAKEFDFEPLAEQCDVPCHNDKRFGGIVSDVWVEGTDWKFIFSMEGSSFYPQLQIMPEAYHSERFYATTSFRSEVPLPYFSWAEYDITGQAVDYNTSIKGASFMAKNCGSRSNREGIVKEMQNSTFRVDSLSKCLKNAQPPQGGNMKDKVDIMKRYLFHLSFENSREDDYITEKLWGALGSGTLPVYFGAPNVKDHAPPNSIILVDDFETTQDLVEHLNEVARNKTMYDSYHEWRTKPLAASFQQKYNFTHTHSTCRLCRWAFSRLYGLGFDHEFQTVRDTKLSRKVCLDSDGFLLHPIMEKWKNMFGEDSDNPARQAPVTLMSPPGGWCKISNPNRSRLMMGGRLRRILWEHDGVVDMTIEAVNITENSVLELMAPTISSSGWSTGTVERGHFIMENDESRVNILTLPRIETATSPMRGSLTLNIPPNALPLKIRVIVDDKDTFHEGAKSSASFFSTLAKEDFYDQIEFFYVPLTTPTN